jgi:hypothetical protein
VATSSQAFVLKQICSLMGFLCVISAAQGQTTANSSAEAINPFNEFMSSSGGVNLFSGDVAFTHHLYTLQGRNGFDLAVDFKYSGNVQLNVLARNDKAPTDWVGLGWRFSFGNIRCDPNQTVTLKDDRCHYVSPNGVSQEILSVGTEFLLEKDPYWKVDTTLSADGERILGWTLRDVQGRKFLYGDFQEAISQRKATRYTFAWTGAANNNANYVGEGFAGTPHLFPIQWDLIAQEDESGQRIVFEYEQKLEALKKGTWTSPVAYTKASYLKSITVPGGGRAEFRRQTKPSGEAYDPKDFHSEPDAFIDPLEEDYLDRVEIRNTDSLKIREYRMVYDLRAFVEKAGYSKRFLKEIKEYGSDGGFVGAHRFTYAVDRPGSGDYPLGTLTDMENPLCGKVHYDFKKVEVKETSRLVSRNELQTFNSKFIPYGGKLPDGREYVVIDNGGNGRAQSQPEFFIYVNEDGVWKKSKAKDTTGQELGDDLGLVNDPISYVVPGEGFFIIVKIADGKNSKVSIFEWNGKEWRSTRMHEKLFSGQLVGNASGQKAALFSYNPPLDIIFLDDPETMAKWGELGLTKGNNPGIMSAYLFYKEGGEWREKVIDTKVGNVFPSTELVGNHFLWQTSIGVSGIGTRKIDAYSWNGSSFAHTMQTSINRLDDWGLNDGFVGGVEIATDPAGVHEISANARALNWNGMNWEFSMRRTLSQFDGDLFPGDLTHLNCLP